MTSRELVSKTLDFGSPERIPRQLWLLPWAEIRYPSESAMIRERYPDDIVQSPPFFKTPLRTRGREYEPGVFVDEWGCRFENRQRGVIGEVRDPLLKDWKDLDSVRPPVERLSVDVRKVDGFCASTEAFVLARTGVRPFEQLQFLRGPANLFLDLASPPDELLSLIERIHGFYREEMELWAGTAVDALFFADDWGSQTSLLVSPALFRRLFLPLYRDYADIARRSGKRLFMHTDGNVTDILADLVEIGVDAVNSQLFCMDIEELGRRFAGKITFWGEIDRQHLLAFGTPGDIRAAVERVAGALYREGGVIAQCEFGVGALPENVAAVFEAWNNLKPL
jgi:hypothetical protein